jgi:flagellar protein FlaI
MADYETPGGVRRWLLRTVETLRGSTVDPTTYDPATHGRLVSIDPLDAETETDRYWLDAPFAFASIAYDEATDEHRYRVVEPALDDLERELLTSLAADVRDHLLYRAADGDGDGDGDGLDPEAALREETATRLSEYGVDVDARTFLRLFYYLDRSFRGYGRLDPLLCDPRIEDISCDGPGMPVYAYHDDYTDIETNVEFEADELDAFVVRLAQQSGRHVSVGDPVAAATLPDGSRAELAFGEEVTPHGSAFTIRKYSEEPMTPIDLLEYGTYDLASMAYLWLAIEHNKNLVFVGGTAAGKTTSMNAVSMFIPPRSKVITIEDTRELALHHDNWLSSVTREGRSTGSAITMYDLLRAALRHRPEYIVVGEVRGQEAITLFQAMNTGHTTLSTMHADSVRTAINRLENRPIDVPRQMVESLDVLVVQTLARVDGERVRRAATVAEIEGVDGRTGELDYGRAFAWDAATDGFTAGSRVVAETIRSERGWSRPDLLRELERRRRFLDALRNREFTDYRRFTSMIARYYADPERAVDRIGAGQPASTGERDLS